MKSYLTPIEPGTTETIVVNSRFITSIARVDTTADVKQFLAQIRTQLPDASHHVYAFRVGHGNRVVEGMSDDGEPSGSAGRPGD